MAEGFNEMRRDLIARFRALQNNASTTTPPPYWTNPVLFSGYGGPPLPYPGYLSHHSYPVYGCCSSLPPYQYEYPMAVPMPPQAAAAQAAVIAASSEHRIFVAGLDPRIDLYLFEKIFRVFGEVCNVSLNERRRCGFVSYGRKREARSAITLHGVPIFGSTIGVEWAYGWPREDPDESDAEHLLAILCAQPEFQHFQRKSELLLAVLDQVDQKNPRVLLLLRQKWEELGHMVTDLTEEEDPLPPLVVAGTSPLESSLGENIERAPSTSVTPRISQLQSEPHTLQSEPSSVPESVEPTEHLLAILRAQPEFQHFRRKSDLLLAVIDQVDQKNPRVLRILRQNLEEFEGMVRDLTGEEEPLPPLVVAGTSPLESSLGEDIERAAAPSTSVTPRISQLQSEPHIPHNGLAIASEPESVEPYGATNTQETEIEVRRAKRPNDQKEDQKGKKTKVEETKTVCKICMDEEVGVVFLPCGHLVSCPRCAERISNCPMCRKQITGKVRTYMS